MLIYYYIYAEISFKINLRLVKKDYPKRRIGRTNLQKAKNRAVTNLVHFPVLITVAIAAAQRIRCRNLLLFAFCCVSKLSKLKF